MVGSGAREHALVWKLKQSPRVTEIFVAPGNGGTALIAQNLDISASDIPGLIKAALDLKVNFTVVGPEGPLAAGIADNFLIRGMPVFGATRMAAEIESSKIFSKSLMQKYKIPCPGSTAFTDYAAAVSFVKKQIPPIVVKADGLAAGKGVVIAQSVAEAIAAIDEFMQKKTLGEAGQNIIIEEFLAGREMSAFAFTDAHFTAMATYACDYKRVFDNDEGPNTGGMGGYSPPYFLNITLADQVLNTIMQPTINALHDEGRPYRGVLYGGLMINNNQAKVLEFNARFGDPETQVIMPRLKTDLLDIMLAIDERKLNGLKIEWADEVCMGVVMASGGYPGHYETGYPITGLDTLDKDVMVFHAGTKTGSNGQILTAGGRVLTVVATGKDLNEARKKVYANLPRINFKDCHYRKDIALIKE